MSSLFKKLGYLLNLSRKIIINFVFFGFLILILVSLSEEETIQVPQSAALLLNPAGKLVEQKFEVDPVDALMKEAVNGQQDDVEVLLSDVVKVIDEAAIDSRIEVLVLKLNRLANADITKATEIAKAINNFKQTGKKVIAIGDGYTQQQYYLASYADEIWMNPRGWLLLDGYARKQLYFSDALEKLGVTQHIFRVGTYKSAVEPYTRNDMSEEAKEANRLWLNELWQQYKMDVATQRDMPVENFDETIEQLVAKLTQANGNFAEYALANGWVDALKTRDEINHDLIELVGDNTYANKFDHVDFNEYLSLLPPAIDPFSVQDQIALVVAKGNILDGNQPAGLIGGDSTAALIRKARLNDQVKAIVLRVDSGGGSAFASDIIRREIDLAKDAGKPVVASMGTLAASGGYWISAPADEIIASPTTITGSIGIFGMFMTFENTLEKLGVYTDGVGTTEFANIQLTEKLPDQLGQVFQLNLNRGYQDFIELVATNRDMTPEQVDKVAQGRVWSGQQALKLGLVDSLGGISDAFAAAARLAELEAYDIKVIEKQKDPFDQMIQEIFGQASLFMMQYGIIDLPTPSNSLDLIADKLTSEFKQLNNFNDPQGIYSICLTCEIN